MSVRKTVAWAGFLLGLGTLVLQYGLTLAEYLADGDTVLAGTVHYLGFLTNLANIGIVVAYAGAIAAPSMAWARNPRFQGSALATIVLVALFYHFILKPTLTPPEGLEVYTDLFKHYLLPALYVVWWLVWPAGGKLRFADLPWLGIPAIAYPVYVFARGAIIDAYPYSVIDVTEKGYAGALSYAGMVIVGFAVLCALIVVVDRILGRAKARHPAFQ